MITDGCMPTVLTAVEIREYVWKYFPTVAFTLHLERKPLYYIVNLVLPCCLLSFIALAAFLLQPSSSDRLAIGTRVFTARSELRKVLVLAMPVTVSDCV